MKKIKFVVPFFFLALIVFAIWLWKLNKDINNRLQDGWFPPVTEVYAQGETLLKGAAFTDSQIEELFLYSQLTTTKSPPLENKEYLKLNKEECVFNLNELIQKKDKIEIDLIKSCYLLHISNRERILIAIDLTNKISHLFKKEKEVSQYKLPPFLVAQYHDKTPFLRTNVGIGDIPLQCLQAITAVEDNHFLEHRGISFKGILRAIVKNLSRGSIAEGASTITQQLVKNYFLSPERTFKRKFKELFMSILLEAKVSKDDILSNYLNVIYLGQSGPFQVRGYAAAARFYFKKEIQKLNLSDCAMMAALVNNPGRYNPFKNPDQALARRQKVLNHMLKESYISDLEFQQAQAAKLPPQPKFESSQFSSYFLSAIRQELDLLKIKDKQGKRVFTSLSPFRQIHAQNVVTQILKKLNAKKNSVKLQASLINIDIKTGSIRALIGGKNFQTSPFNRAINAKRQVGSLMKPFVYLAALESTSSEGVPYSALTLLPDKLTTHKYEGQSWTPRNYSRTYQESVPLFYALKNSINSPTAQLGLNLGISSVIDIAKRLGVGSPLKAVPSLTLGALELSQLELAQAYVNIANQGFFQPIRFINKVTAFDQSEIFHSKTQSSGGQRVASDVCAQLVNMLQQTVFTGTARSLKTWRGFLHPVAGKTGTTNNTKDAWFVGFSPDTLTIVWVGNDQNKPTKLTGSSGALPIWADYMKKVLLLYPIENDFQWPDNLDIYELPAPVLKTLVPSAKDHELVTTQLLLPKQEIKKFKKKYPQSTIRPNIFNNYLQDR